MPKVDEELLFSCSQDACLRSEERRGETRDGLGVGLDYSTTQPEAPASRVSFFCELWVFPALTYRFLPAVSRARGAHYSAAIRRFASR
jgi:hypothetical protein